MSSCDNQKIRKLAERHTLARRALMDLLVTFGDKHPQIARAEADIALAQARLLAEEQTTAPMTAKELAETGQVVPAQAVTIPSGPGTASLLALALLGGGIAGIGFALLLELRHTASRRALLSRLSGQDQGRGQTGERRRGPS